MIVTALPRLEFDRDYIFMINKSPPLICNTCRRTITTRFIRKLDCEPTLSITFNLCKPQNTIEDKTIDVTN